MDKKIIILLLVLTIGIISFVLLRGTLFSTSGQTRANPSSDFYVSHLDNCKDIEDQEELSKCINSNKRLVETLEDCSAYISHEEIAKFCESLVFKDRSMCIGLIPQGLCEVLHVIRNKNVEQCYEIDDEWITDRCVSKIESKIFSFTINKYSFFFD